MRRLLLTATVVLLASASTAQAARPVSLAATGTALMGFHVRRQHPARPDAPPQAGGRRATLLPPCHVPLPSAGSFYVIGMVNGQVMCAGKQG